MECHLSRVGHVGINVSDMDNSIEFYRKVLGLKLTGRWGPPDFPTGICFMRIEAMHHNLVLFELPSDVDRSALSTETDSTQRRDVGLNHIAFEVAEREDWLELLDHVRSLEIELVSGPYVHAHEAQDDNGFIGGSGSHSFYFLDPDGNRIEVYCWMMNVSKPSVSAPNPDL